MEGIRPIRNDRLSDKVAQQIVQLIRTGKLPVGTRLSNEAQLSQQLGVSRGILREALTVLQLQGYISRAPKEGTIVQRVSGVELGVALTHKLRAAQYCDLLEFREAMECRVVQNVIALASDAELDDLQALLDTAPEAGMSDSPDYYFHYRMAELSGNSLFAVFLNMYYDMIHEMTLVAHRDANRQRDQQREHQRILDALRKRDPRLAVRAVRSHLKKVQRAVILADGE